MLQNDAHLEIPSPYYRVSLKAIILDGRQRLLVIKDSGDGAWELPGGGWDHGESLQQCLQREIIEELGVKIKNIDFSTIYPYVSKGRTGHWRLKMAVRLELASNNFTLNKQYGSYNYVTAAELVKLNMISSESGIKGYVDLIWPRP